MLTIVKIFIKFGRTFLNDDKLFCQCYYKIFNKFNKINNSGTICWETINKYKEILTNMENLPLEIICFNFENAKLYHDSFSDIDILRKENKLYIIDYLPELLEMYNTSSILESAKSIKKLIINPFKKVTLLNYIESLKDWLYKKPYCDKALSLIKIKLSSKFSKYDFLSDLIFDGDKDEVKDEVKDNMHVKVEKDDIVEKDDMINKDDKAEKYDNVDKKD